MKPRQAAWEFLRDSSKRDSYINLEIENLHQRIKPNERAFATELIFGSVRMRLRLDDTIEKLIDRAIEDEVRDLLRLGLYEVIFMKTADHALVNEYVEVSKVVLGKARSSFINAVLRRACRERDSLQSEDGLSLEVKTSHPKWIVNAFSHLLEGEQLS
ncbi:MAG: transcription antitermination factor NusB, partial [Actinomycetota bacterium]